MIPSLPPTDDSDREGQPCYEGHRGRNTTTGAPDGVTNDKNDATTSSVKGTIPTTQGDGNDPVTPMTRARELNDETVFGANTK